MTSSDVGHWQCEKTLPQCMEYMLENKLLCDVTFVVGEGRDEVHAHKLMLASRSPVFYAMLDGPLAEKGKIEIPDIDKDTFLKLLRYVYTDNILLDAKNALTVMYAAKKYCLDLLTKSCSEYLKEKISPDNACTILDAAFRFSEENVVQKCLEVIMQNTHESISCDGFEEIGKKTLIHILKVDEMCIEEEKLYEKVMKWSEAECRRQNIKDNMENRRVVLGDALYEIRFPLMNQEYFARKIGKTNLLSPEEKVEVLMNYILKTDAPTKMFKTSKRQRNAGKCERVIRFQEQSSGLWNLSGSIDAITFKVSHDSVLHGVAVYGCKNASCDYSISVVVKDSCSRELVSHTTEFKSNANEEVHDVKFDNILPVRANNCYTIEMKMVGPRSRRGQGGMESVEYGNGKIVTFSSSPSSKNGSNLSGGQIPGLLLSSWGELDMSVTNNKCECFLWETHRSH